MTRSTILLAACLLLAQCGCLRTVKVRQFDHGFLRPGFENWVFFVSAWAEPLQPWEKGEEGPAHHRFEVKVMGSTFHGMAVRGPESFRETAYDVHFDSLRMTHLVEGAPVDLPLGEFERSWDQEGRVANLRASDAVPIDPAIRRIRAEVTVSFTHKQTGKVQKKDYVFSLRRHDGSTLIPDIGE